MPEQSVTALKAEIKRAQPAATPKLQKISSSGKVAKNKAVARPNLSVTLRQWHQRTGLFAFLFMGWLGFSGVLLNQSASWGLDAIRVKSEILMSMYGLHTEVPETGYLNAGHWLVTTTETTVLDGQPIEQRIPSPLGLTTTGSGEDELIFVATKDKLTVFSGKGEKVDELSDYMLPVAAIQNVGTTILESGESMVVVKGENNYGSIDGLVWDAVDSDAQIKWSSPEPLDESIRNTVSPFARPTVALEQVLIDLHSGRLFGAFGPYVINTVGLAAVLLSITGVWMMWRTNRRRRSRK